MNALRFHEIKNWKQQKIKIKIKLELTLKNGTWLKIYKEGWRNRERKLVQKIPPQRGEGKNEKMIICEWSEQEDGFLFWKNQIECEWAAPAENQVASFFDRYHNWAGPKLGVVHTFGPITGPYI